MTGCILTIFLGVPNVDGNVYIYTTHSKNTFPVCFDSIWNRGDGAAKAVCNTLGYQPSKTVAKQALGSHRHFVKKPCYTLKCVGNEAHLGECRYDLTYKNNTYQVYVSCMDINTLEVKGGNNCKTNNT